METFFTILQAALGIGLLVFVHEAGHFIAARLCGVDCYVFSLGYGPRIAGFNRNGCDFRISLIPIGGYVRMAGEIGENDEGPSDGSLARKSPLQRIFVYSAGVLMNFIIAFIIFPIVYFTGVPANKPVVGSVTPGSPAWHARIAPGSVITAINGTKIVSFDQIPIEVAVSSSPLKLEYNEPIPGNPGEYRPRVESIATDYHEERGMPYLGVEAGLATEIARNAQNISVRGLQLTVRADSPAYEAGVRTGDLLIGIDGKSIDAGSIRYFAERLGDPGGATLLQFAAGKDSPPRSAEELAKITIPDGIPLAARPVKDTERTILGVAPAKDLVKGVRKSSIFEKLKLTVGDRILRINGKPFVNSADFARVASAAEDVVKLSVLRGDATVALEAKLTQDERAQLQDGVALGENDKSNRIFVKKNTPAERGGLQAGDRIIKVGSVEITKWEQISKTVLAAPPEADLAIEIERDLGEGMVKLTKTIRPARTPEFDFGIGFVDDRVLVRANDLGEAIQLGFGASTRFIKQIIIFLKKIALGQVAANKNVAGPILLAATTYQLAHEGFIQLLYFLAVLSLNLALINLLPIPLLDGGNLFFVIIEAIKGSPVSERVIGASQTVGIFLLITLMVWVTFHDLKRLVVGWL